MSCFRLPLLFAHLHRVVLLCGAMVSCLQRKSAGRRGLFTVRRSRPSSLTTAAMARWDS